MTKYDLINKDCCRADEFSGRTMVLGLGYVSKIMDEYAKQECIAFAEWKDENFMFLPVDKKYYRREDGSKKYKDGIELLDLKQIFTLYLTNQSK